jgi:hypothetical protein
MNEITFVTSYDNDCGVYADTLMTLVSNDKYLCNITRRNEEFKKDRSIVSGEYVLTIGNEASKNNLQNFKDKYNNFGIHFGYHGTKAWICCESFKWDKESLFKFHSELISVLDEFGMKTDNIDDRVKEFLENKKKNMNSYNGKKAQLGDLANEVLMTNIAVTSTLMQSIWLVSEVLLFLAEWIYGLREKSELRKQQYKYAIVLFYKRYIHEFLKIDEMNDKETSEKMDF